MKNKVISKGYTITVVSWENDGDNYNTNSITVESKEMAEAYYNMMQLCRSKNNRINGEIGLGNTSDGFNRRQRQAIISLFDNYPILLHGTKIDEDEDDDLDYLFMEISGDLLGSSEFYTCRVMESCSITYSPEDIYLETVEF